MRVSYVRVSTAEQNEARQVEALKQHNIEKWYVEKVSAKDTKREQLQLMLDFVREGDEVYVMDFSRLSRSVQCPTAHCGRSKPQINFCDNSSPIAQSGR